MIKKKLKRRLLRPEYLFDFLIIISILSFVFIFISKYFLKEDVFIKATIKVIPEKWFWGEPAPPNWYVLSVKKGDKEFGGLGKMIAEVSDVITFDTGGTGKLLYLKTRLRSTYQKNTKQYLFKNKPLELNSPVELHLKNTNINGVIVQINDYPKFDLEKYLLVTVKLYDRYPWYADSIKIGDRFSVGKQILAEVKDKEVELAQKTVMLQGNVAAGTILEDPLKRDITLKVKIKVRKEGEKDWVFRTDQLVKIGNELNIPLDNNVNLFSANILSIEEE